VPATPNPAEAVDLIKVNWEKVEIPHAKFEQLHRDLTSALSQYSSNIQARFALVLLKGGVQHLHKQEYAVVYDNKGFERIKVEAWDDTDDPTRMNPVIKWVHAILKLSKESDYKTVNTKDTRSNGDVAQSSAPPRS
jgi:hypothetical protein